MTDAVSHAGANQDYGPAPATEGSGPHRGTIHAVDGGR